MVPNTIKYRLAKMCSNHPINSAYVLVVHGEESVTILEKSLYFIEWITDWKEL